MIVRDEDEGIHRCRIRVDVHPKSYGDIVCRALQRAAVIVAREEEDEEEEAAVRGKGAREGAEAEAETEARFGRSASSSSPPLRRRRGKTSDPNPIRHPRHSRYIGRMA